jgi:TPR repeat protein
VERSITRWRDPRLLVLFAILASAGPAVADAPPATSSYPPQLRQELFSTDERVRLEAIEAVPQLGESGRGLAWTLIEKLDGPEPDATAAERSLGAFDAATSILVEGMANSTGGRRQRLMRLLAARGPRAEAALRGLEVLAGSDDEPTRAVAREAVEAIRGAPVGPVPDDAGMAVTTRSDDHLQDAVEEDRRFCEQHDWADCFREGARYGDGRGVVRDPVRAARFFACSRDKGSADGFVRLGEAYFEGRGVRRDPIRGVALFREACAGRHPAGCGFLAQAYRLGEGVPRDLVVAARHERQGCELGGATNCFNFAVALYLGEAGPAGVAAARAWYERGCAGGEKASCEQAAATREIEPSERACRAGRGSACAEAGEKVRWAIRTPVSPRLSLQLFERGCALEHATSCYRAAFQHEQGEGTRADAARAARLYAKACHGGAPWACLGLASLCDRGEGVARDPARARELRLRACRGGVEQGCDPPRPRE